MSSSTEENRLAESLQEKAKLSTKDSLSSTIPRRPHPSSLPPSITRLYKVDSIPTNISVQIFSDRIVLNLSQLPGGKVGTFLLCEATHCEIDPKAIDYNVSTLLGGGGSTLLEVFARQVCETIARNRTPVQIRSGWLPILVLGVSLDKAVAKDPALFRELVHLLVSVYHDLEASSSI